MSTITPAKMREAQAIDKFTVRGIIPGDPVAEMMARDDAESGPVPQVRSAKLEAPRPGSFRFRTKPGHGMTYIPLRIYRETDDLEQNVKLKKRWERNATRVWGKDFKKVLAVDADLYDKRGMTQIDFRRIPGVKEASYETRDVVIAAYIRERIKEPDYVGIIYEEIADMEVTLESGEVILVRPADEHSRAVMAAQAAAGS